MSDIGWVNGVGNPQVVAEKSQTNENVIDAALLNTHIDQWRFLQNTHTHRQNERTLERSVKYSSAVSAHLKMNL